jgi:hypothetical protein
MQRKEAVMRRTRFLPLFLVIVLAGCSLFLPKTTALEDIHNQYRAEYATMVLPEPGEQPELGVAVSKSSGFPKTLEAIRAFGLKYGRDSREYAHLTVLEGMIYLQSGQFGLASAVELEVKSAGAKLYSGTGHLTRDALLAENFGYLVTGWREIHRFTENVKAKTAGKPEPFPAPDFEKVRGAAEHIDSNLMNGMKEYPDRFADPEVDQGAIYLAATAAAFYTWVQKVNNQHCPSENLPNCTEERWKNKTTAVFYKKGRDLIGMFLTDSEKTSAVYDNRLNLGSSVGRVRYLNWYGWLSEKVPE